MTCAFSGSVGSRENFGAYYSTIASDEVAVNVDGLGEGGHGPHFSERWNSAIKPIWL